MSAEAVAERIVELEEGGAASAVPPFSSSVQ